MFMRQSKLQVFDKLNVRHAANFGLVLCSIGINVFCLGLAFEIIKTNKTKYIKNRNVQLIEIFMRHNLKVFIKQNKTQKIQARKQLSTFEIQLYSACQKIGYIYETQKFKMSSFYIYLETGGKLGSS